VFIVDVRMGSADVRQAARFYREVLELPVAVSEGIAVVTVGASTITLVEDATAREGNHLAFTIPSNLFADAKRWLAERVEPMRWGTGEDELRLGEPWNSESVYFLGPDGVILEAITRHSLGNASGEPFSSAQLLCVSEVGLATSDVAGTFAAIRQQFGIETFAGESPDFTTAGDQQGLLILVTAGRSWFPTDHVGAATESLQVSIGGTAAGEFRAPEGWTVRSVLDGSAKHELT